ncbi:MAG: serine/threonine-protein phosphatase [Lachnospiraceae bacterium]|nr:serine/threonine-protein phosphatase [Lachnospiraceae bacterium]
MNYFVAYNTDVGIRKNTNEDSIAVKVLDTPGGRAVFAIACDGMGGLSAGELASKEVIMAYCNWFDTSFAPMAANEAVDRDQIMEEWRSLALAENSKLGSYGLQKNAGLGTTLSAILLYQGQYLIIHVGDSRIYEMKDDEVRQMTEDQSLVAREIAAGRLTPEEALRDSRRSILLQCVGASATVEPAFYQGIAVPETSYLICTDGFCHEISHEEMLEQLGPRACVNATVMRQNCMYLTELIKQRKEQDNISLVLLKTY